MAKDIIITPASGEITFLENGVQVGRFHQSGSDIYLSTTGSLYMGDGSPSNLQLGDVTTSVDIEFLGGGTITSNAGTLSLGIAGDTINLNVSGVTYQLPTHSHNISEITNLQTTLNTFATTGYVSTQIGLAIANLIDSAPGTLDTLNELAAALGDDPNFATTITNALAGKLSTSGKAADSNLLDGIDSASFLRSDVDDTFGDASKTLTIQGVVRSNNNGNVYGPNFNVSTTNKDTQEYAYRVDRSGTVVGGIKINGQGVFADGLTVGTASFSASTINNWNTAYGWGDHSGLYAAASHTHSYLPLSGGSLSGDLNLNYTYPRINFYDSNNNPDYSLINNDGAFTIYDITNNVHRLWVAGTGNIGIGTTNPIYPFQVVGNAYVNGGTLFLDSTQYLRWGDSNQGIVGENNNGISIVAGGSTRQTIYGAGYTYFPGLDLAISNANSDHGRGTYFRGSNSHFVLGLTNGNTLYLNYGNAGGSMRTYGTWYHQDTQILSTSRVLTNVSGNISMFTNDSGYVTGSHSHTAANVHSWIYTTGGDANTYTTFGIYRNYAVNGPIAGHNTILHVTQSDGNYGFQLGADTTSSADGLYYRSKDTTVGTWKQVASRDWVQAQGYITSAGNNYYTTSASFNASTGVITGTRNDGGTWTVDIDGRFLTSYTETDTLASVTARGGTTTSAVNFAGSTIFTGSIGNSTTTVPSVMIGLSSGNDPQIQFTDSGYNAHIDFGASAGDDFDVRIIHSGANTLDIQGAGSSGLKVNSQTVWNAGNDGAGSGLDADLLDGLQATAFATAAQGAKADTALQSYTETDTLASVTNRGATTPTHIYINNSSPTLYLQDTDNRSAMVHVNSNYFYILNGSANNSTSWAQQANSRWLFMGNLNTNDITFGGGGDFAGSLVAPAVYGTTTYFGADASHGYAETYGGVSSGLRRISYITMNNGSSNWNDSFYHGIQSTDNAGNYSDSISINSYNDITLRLDTNNNNGASYLRITNNTSSTGGNTIAYIGHDGSTNVSWFSGVVTAGNDFRAPIFYDSADTSYYLDPNSTSNLNRIYANNNIYTTILYDYNDNNYYLDPNGTSVLGAAHFSSGILDNASARIYMPGGAYNVNNSSGTVGAIRINMPTAVYGTNTMMSMTVQVYEYSTGQSFTIRCGGYNYYNHDWYNVFAFMLSDSGKGGDVPVYFGNDGTRDVIWIGNPDWSWSYPNVFVTDFQSGHTQNSNWKTGWSVSWDTAARTNVTASRTAYRQIDLGNYATHLDSRYYTESEVNSLLSSKANLASPGFTGTPTAPTASAATNNTQIATTQYVTTAINNLINSAPGALNTLDELAAALGDDANFASNVTNSIATKVPLSGEAALSGMKKFETNVSSQDDWQNSPVSILERDGIGSGSSSDIYAPNLNFHWRNRVSRSLWMAYNGDLHYGEYNGSGAPGDSGVFYVGGGNSNNWNAAYSWGNHANAGYTSNTGTVTSVSGTGSYGGLSLSGTVTGSGNITLSGTPTGTWPISVSGNAATATSATSATSAASWTTARTITIGNTGKSVNGSGNVSWSLAEIGAQAAGSYASSSHNHDTSYLPMSYTDIDMDAYDQDKNLLLGRNVGSWGSGTKPGGSHNGFGILHVSTHISGYATQLGFDTNQNALWIRSANPTTWGTWTRLIDTSNIGSQSVNYATSAGNADTVDGWHRDDIRAWTNITGKPTTLAGYGITDALGTSTSGGVSFTGNSTIRKIFIDRSGSAASGISWYSSGFTSWATYMGSAGQTGLGATGNITAPSGTYVTSWALRNFIENANGYGWTWEAGTATGQPSIVAELSSSSGNFRTVGTIYASGGNSSEWNSAYSERYRWDGGASGINAATGRASLGLGTAATSNTGDFAAASHSHTFASLTSKPTTISGYGITDAITTGNIGSQSVSYSAASGTAGTSLSTSRGIIEDTRSAQRTPNDYDDYRVSFEFTNQMPHDSNWLSIMTMQGWSNGYNAWQIQGPATSSDQNSWYLRSGRNTTWGTANLIIHSGNISSQSVNYANSAGSATNADTVDSLHASSFLRSDTTNSVYRVTAGDGNRIQFWDSTNYAIWMSSTGNSTWGGRLDTTSDYNMYFRMASGTNRGFVFKNSTTDVAQIAGDGTIYTASHGNSSNWKSAYDWGNHANAGYLTSVPAQSFASLTGKPTTLAGYGITDAATSGHNHDSTYLGISATAADSNKLGGIAASSYSQTSHNHTYNVNDAWLRDNGDNANVKLYGNSRQMVFRTDGTTEYAAGVGGYPFAWMYGGDAASNRRMLMDTSGNIWTNSYGWLHSYFQAAGSAINTGNIGSQSVEYSNRSLRLQSSIGTWGGAVTFNNFRETGRTRVYDILGYDKVSSTNPPATPLQDAAGAGAFNYGTLLSVSGDYAHFEMYMPNNTNNIVHPEYVPYFRTGYQGSWSNWSRLVTSVDNTTTLVGNDGTALVIDSQVGWNTPASSILELNAQSDNWASSSFRFMARSMNSMGTQLLIDKYTYDGGWRNLGYVPENGDDNLFWMADVLQGASDSRLKTNVNTLTGALETVSQLRAVTFDWDPEMQEYHRKEGSDLGFIAQEIEELIPEVVATRPDGYKTVKYEKVVPVLVEAIKEQQATINALIARIEALENK